MTNSILIFGAGINQLELIKAAKELNIISVVIDPSENPVGKEFADFYYQVAGDDYFKTKEIAIKHSVKGIVTGQMEKPLKLMANLAQELGFIFHSPEVIEKSVNKWLMKQSFMDNNIDCAKGKIFYKEDNITFTSINNLSFPLIMKPLNAFSSRGVKRINNFEELKLMEIDTRNFSSDESIIIEEFLEGREFSVESITYKGETTVVQITEKFITPYPYTVEMAHLQPARISNEERKSIEELVKKAINAISIDNSASHAEVMLTTKGPFMIEIGARLGGDFISSHLTLASTGVSMDKAAIQVALGIKPNLEKTLNNMAMIKYLNLEEGKKVLKLLPIEDLMEIEGVVFAYYFLKKNDIIQKITNSAQRPACLLLKDSRLENLFDLMEQTIETLKTKIILA